MAERKEPTKLPAAVAAGSGFLVLALAVLVFYLRGEAERAQRELGRSIGDYKRMEVWKKEIEEKKKRHPKGTSTQKPGDLLSFLSTKARQAGIPAGILNITPNPPATVGGWRETSYQVTLRATKESPLPRASVVDFVTRVEDESPVRSRDLTLEFAGSDFQVAVVRFSFYERADAGPK